MHKLASAACNHDQLLHHEFLQGICGLLGIVGIPYRLISLLPAYVRRRPMYENCCGFRCFRIFTKPVFWQGQTQNKQTRHFTSGIIEFVIAPLYAKLCGAEL
jgi:hypothetical protein